MGPAWSAAEHRILRLQRQAESVMVSLGLQAFEPSSGMHFEFQYCVGHLTAYSDGLQLLATPSEAKQTSFE